MNLKLKVYLFIRDKCEVTDRITVDCVVTDNYLTCLVHEGRAFGLDMELGLINSKCNSVERDWESGIEDGRGLLGIEGLRLPIGSRVVGAFIMPCGSCSYCSKGHDDLCEDFFAYNRAKGTLYDGETRLFLRSSGKPVYMYSMGGLAEYCVVPANALTILPKSLPYTESAILGCAVFTAYGAMAHAAEVRPGDSVAIIGTGGVGSSCLQIARAFGASDIIAVDIQDDKLQKAKIFGATHVINAAKENAVDKILEITGGKGVDVAVEALGKPQTFLQCTQSVRDGGKAVFIGLTAVGVIGEVDINRLVRRKIQIIGSYGGRARQDLPKIVRLAERGIFDLSSAVSRRYKFEESASAYQDLNQGSIVGRAVVEIM